MKEVEQGFLLMVTKEKNKKCRVGNIKCNVLFYSHGV